MSLADKVGEGLLDLGRGLATAKLNREVRELLQQKLVLLAAANAEQHAKISEQAAGLAAALAANEKLQMLLRDCEGQKQQLQSQIAVVEGPGDRCPKCNHPRGRRQAYSPATPLRVGEELYKCGQCGHQYKKEQR